MNSCNPHNKRNSNGRALVSHAKFYSSPSPSTKYAPVIQTTILYSGEISVFDPDSHDS